MELKDFAAHVAEKFNVHKIEAWSPDLSFDRSEISGELRAAVEKAHSAIVILRWTAGAAGLLAGCGRA